MHPGKNSQIMHPIAGAQQQAVAFRPFPPIQWIFDWELFRVTITPFARKRRLRTIPAMEEPSDKKGSYMTVPCIRCPRTAEPYFTAKDYNRKLSNESFTYYRCGCGIIFLNPVPADLGRYYPDEYYEIPRTLGELAKKARTERFKIKIVNRFAKGKRLLEIGPMYGNFVYLAKEAGFAVTAIEYDAKCCSFLNNTVGIRAINNPDTIGALKELGEFDVIVLWHVIEHLPNLAETVRALAEKIAVGGILVIAAPNPDSFQFKKLLQYWMHVDAPRHLQLIPKLTLDAMVNPLGLEFVWGTTNDPNTKQSNKSGWKESCGYPYPDGLKKKLMRKLGRYIGLALWFYENIEGNGSAYNAVYVKREPLQSKNGPRA